MGYRFSAEVPLRWVDVDSEGVVNNAVYLSLMEEARFQYFDRLGLLPDRRVQFFLREATVRYVSPGRMGMRTRVAARTERLGNSSFVMTYQVHGDGTLLAEGQAVLVFVGSDGRPTAVPAPVRAAISAFEEIPAQAPPPVKA